MYSCCFIYCILYSSVLSGFKPEKSTWYDSWTWMQSGFDRRSFQIFSYEPWFHSNDIRISPTIFLWWKRYDHFLYICWYFAEYLPKSESHWWNQTETLAYSFYNWTGMTYNARKCAITHLHVQFRCRTTWTINQRKRSVIYAAHINYTPWLISTF